MPTIRDRRAEKYRECALTGELLFAWSLNKDCENCLIQDWVTIAKRALRPRNHNQRVRVL